MNGRCGPTTDWQAVDPKNAGMNAEMLSKLEPAITSEYGNINGIVVVRNWSIAYERYFNGYGPDDSQHIASATKSVLSALIGIAVEEGAIRSIDQKVLEFFPEYAAESPGGEITIRHLLTMTAPYPFPDWQEPLDQMCMQPNWIKYVLGMLGQGGRIGDFKYSTAGAHLLSAILTRSIGGSAREYANEHLFKPIGVKEIPDYGMESYGFDELFGHKVKGWVQDPSGLSTGGWGLTLTPREMAHFGLLYLNGGSWDGKQVVPEAWIRESTATAHANRYGYLWWVREENGVYAYMAMGDGGNAICCVPDQKLVVAIASTFIPNPRDRWSLIESYVLPAVID